MDMQSSLDHGATSDEGGAARDNVRPAQRGRVSPNRPHLFLFPGMGGYDPNLAKVGIACKQDLETVQIGYPSWRTLLHDPEFSLAALVNDAIEQIARHGSTGPVLLAGYSFGGIVAFAVATRLCAAGRSVCFLGILDSEARPGADITPGALRAPMTLRQELAGFVTGLRRGEGTSKIAYATARRLKSPRWSPLLQFYARVPRRWLPKEFRVYLDRDLLSQHMEPLLHQWNADLDDLPPLQVPTYLFRTAQHSAKAPPHLGWDHCCPNLTVVAMSGTHLGMLGPSGLPTLCAAFSKAVTQVLERAQAQ